MSGAELEIYTLSIHAPLVCQGFPPFRTGMRMMLLFSLFIRIRFKNGVQHNGRAGGAVLRAGISGFAEIDRLPRYFPDIRANILTTKTLVLIVWRAYAKL